jgi:hypothetical protein
VVAIEYYVSTCPRQGLERANPAGLFRCVRAGSWLAAHYLEAGKWRQSSTLAHEMTSGLGPLQRIGFDEAMAVLRARGGKPDGIDERAQGADREASGPPTGLPRSPGSVTRPAASS